MTFAKLVPALALGMLPLLAQTNPVNVDQVITLEANLSSLNQNPPVFTNVGETPTPGATTISTGTATMTIRFIGANSTNTNPVTGAPLPITGNTSNVSRATVTLSMTPTFVGTQNITSVQIARGAAGVNGAMAFDFNVTSATGTAVNTQMEVTTPAQLTVLREIVNNPSAFYLQVNTEANATGMIRGQLRRGGNTQEDVSNNRLDLVTRLIVRIAYQEGIITVAERDAYLATLPPLPAPTGTNP